MTEFLQAYGSWIIFGLLLVLMFRMHASGQGLEGMMHHQTEYDDSRQHNERYIIDADPARVPPTEMNQADSSHDSDASQLNLFGERAVSPDDEVQPSAHVPRHSGCH